MKNKGIKLIVTLSMVLSTILLSVIGVDAYTIENNFIPFTAGWNTGKVVVLHESGNPNNVGANSLNNEVNFMKNNYFNASAQYFVGSGGRVVKLFDNERKMAYHAGAWGNANGIGIELARTNNRATFEKDYRAYVELARDIAIRNGIPLTLDDGNWTGIKSHLWITNNVWGDHTDPYGYLASWGVSKSKLANDLRNGFGSTGNVVTPKPSTPSVSGNRFTVKTTTNIRTGASLGSTVVGTYSAGQSFVYDKTVKSDGYTWYSYVAYSGNRRYVADVNSYVKPTAVPNNANGKFVSEVGTYTPYYATNVRTGAGTGYTVTGTIPAGYSIRYDGYVVSNGYTWIRYQSYNGTRYIAVRPVGQNAWGTFK